MSLGEYTHKIKIGAVLQVVLTTYPSNQLNNPPAN